MTPDDNTSHRITLDVHLESARKAIHDLSEAHRNDKLSPEHMATALGEIVSNLHRDFPSEHIVEISTADLLSGFWERTQKRRIAAPTGLVFLDAALNGGFQSKRLVVLMGAPGSGKTSLANQIAEKVASERPVLYVTSEDAPDILIAKTLSRIANIDYSDVLYGKRRIDTYDAIEQLRQRSSARLLRYLDVTGGAISLDELEDRARTHFEELPGPGLIVIDYLQRMARATRDLGGVRELREAVTALTERLRALACELDCTVLALASMNRASGYGKNGESDTLSSAKESGDVEYTADVIMGLVKDTSNKRVTSSFIDPRLLRIDKNRLGPTTIINLDWRADRQQFLTVDKEGR